MNAYATKARLRRKYDSTIILNVVGGGKVAAAAALGWVMSDIEMPKYTVVATAGEIEVRDYAPTIIAEVDMYGARQKSLTAGFRLLADYIFGNNARTEPLAMNRARATIWRKSTLEGALHHAIRLSFGHAAYPYQPQCDAQRIAGRRMAVIRFSGLTGTRKLERNAYRLRAFINSKQLKSTPLPVFAFYDPPWTLPFLRRNEVMMELLP